jgi:2-polyprenyl-3-methyl-5-hydroxy-6-metoxy-1,4-benzoquinol methylase
MIRCPSCDCYFILTGQKICCPECKYCIQEKDNIISIKQQESSEFFFPKDDFEILYTYEKDHFWFRSRNRIIGSIIKRYLPDNDNHDIRLCEVGCGTGIISHYLSLNGYHMTCCDLYLDGLHYAHKRGSGERYFQCNLYDLPFFNEFDMVLACDVIEHLDEDKAALSQIFNALKPGGFCLITVPANQLLWSDQDINAGHKRRYISHTLHELVSYTGFIPIRISYFMTVPLPILLVKRLFSRKKETKMQINVENKVNSNELSLPWYINELLYLALLPERIIFPFLNLPFGSSLLCIAQKPNCSE